MILLILLLLLAPIALIDLVFMSEVLAGLKPGRDNEPSAQRQRVALLIPAHNEEGVVRASIEAMRRVAPSDTRLLLVAHNCSDATAAEARAGGAEVVELDRPEERGKGYALAFGRDQLALDPPEVVIVVDADCEPGPGMVERLSARAAVTGRVIQSCYLFRTRPGDPAMVQVSNFAMLVKNSVRQRGARRLGGPAILTGSGMAFPWPVFAGLNLATGNIVEDLAIGVELAERGTSPLFDEQARIWSVASNAAGTQTQRARWEIGYIATGRTTAWPLVRTGLARHRWPLISLGLTLFVPPLTLLLTLNLAGLIFFALAALAGAPGLPLMLTLLLVLAMMGSVLAAWAVAGREVLEGRMLARLPFYLLWKLMMYGRLVRRTQKAAWVRTERTD